MWHQTDLAQGRCTVVRFPNRDLELVLVPVVNKTGRYTLSLPTRLDLLVVVLQVDDAAPTCLYKRPQVLRCSCDVLF